MSLGSRESSAFPINLIPILALSVTLQRSGRWSSDPLCFLLCEIIPRLLQREKMLIRMTEPYLQGYIMFAV